jgi:hypothetical protein
VLRLFVCIRFQVCFTPLIGVLFTFPSRYLFTIGQSVVLSLGGWSPHVQTGLLVSRLTQGLMCFLRIRAYHPLWSSFPSASAYYTLATGLVPFRSPLLRESRLISFPLDTEMFQFSRFASHDLCIQSWIPHKEVGFPIRTSADQRLLTASRGLSQPATSFIASDCQGIHQMHFSTLEFIPRTETNPPRSEKLGKHVTVRS